jgi:hypothetical protein
MSPDNFRIMLAVPLPVVVLVIITIAIAATIVVPRLVPRYVRLADEPDQPRPLGHDMAWLAVKTSDASAVIAALGLTGLRPANWSSGIAAIYDPEISGGLVFVSPPVKGWTIVAGESLPLPPGPSFVDKIGPVLDRLSLGFPAVQYFAAFPVIDIYAWARFEKGRRVRSFAISDSGVLWNAGKPSDAERRLGLSFIEVRGILERHGDVGGELQLYPTEEHVFAIADAWSINPMAIGVTANAHSSRVAGSVGWVADAPRAWRPARIRKVA